MFRRAGQPQALNIETGNYVLFGPYPTDAVLFAYIGGVNAFLGPVLGAAVRTFLSQTLADITLVAAVPRCSVCSGDAVRARWPGGPGAAHRQIAA